jgi:hypothetical protein
MEIQENRRGNGCSIRDSLFGSIEEAEKSVGREVEGVWNGKGSERAAGAGLGDLGAVWIALLRQHRWVVEHKGMG